MIRFWSKVNKSAPGGCWLWTASTSRDGYGQFRFDGKMCRAHRVSWVFVNGFIPDGLQLDHLCRNRRCVNPAHLEPVTSRTNTLRGETFAARFAARNVCPKGHPLTHPRSDGGRRCLVCQAEYHRNRNAERKVG